MQGKSWYFSQNGRVEGPFTREQLGERLNSYDDVMVWNPKLVRWQNANEVFNGSSAQPTSEKKVTSLQEKIIPSLQKLSISEHKLKDVKNKALSARNLKVFAEKWKQLEARHAREKQALLTQLIDHQDTLVSLAKRELKQIQSAELAKKETPTQQMLNVGRKSTLQKSASSTVSTFGNGMATEQKAKLEETKKASNDSYSWPTAEKEPQITAADLEPNKGMSKASLIERSQVGLNLSDDHESMMKRVARRRRRRVR